MIRLGFINNLAQMPPGTPFVRTEKAADVGARPGPCVSTSRDASGRPLFELTYAVPENGGNGADPWPAEMARAIAGLGWKTWRFDPFSPAKVMSESVEQSLGAWGEHFWPALEMDCDVFLDVSSGGRSQVYQAVRIWEKKYRHVRFVRELDLQSRGDPPVQENHSLLNKLKSMAKYFKRTSA